MKRFKCKKINQHHVDFILVVIIIVTLIMLHFYNRNISPKIIDIAVSKTDEINTLLIKRDILPSTNIDDLLHITLNSKEEIIFIETDYNEAYRIMKEVVSKIQNNLLRLERGEIEEFSNNRELHSYNNNLYLLIPLGYSLPGVLFSSIGPKIPIMISMYEHVLGNVETEVVDYGINNALLNVTLTITLEQKIIMPYKEEKITRDYKMVLGSKVINGKVPSIYNGSYKNMSSIFDIS